MSALHILQANAMAHGDVGGVERFADALAEGLRARGHRVTQAFLGDGFGRLGDDLRTVALTAPETRWKVPKPRSWLPMVRSAVRLQAMLREVRPDVVHFNYPTWETTYFLGLRRLNGYRLVLTAHGPNDVPAAWPLSRTVLPHLLERSDAVVAVSDEMAERVRAASGGRAEALVIPNGVDTAFWSPGPPGRPAGRPPGAPGGGPTVVSVGWLKPVKGHDVLVEAFARVRAAVPGARLVLVGRGPGRPDLEGRARALGIGEAVEFAGVLDREGVRERLRAADVFALPSRSEAFGLALLEALSSGLPAVATSVGGIPDILAGGGGVTVPPEDPAALADALVALLRDPARRRAMSADGVARARDFGIDRMVDGYERVLSGP